MLDVKHMEKFRLFNQLYEAVNNPIGYHDIFYIYLHRRVFFFILNTSFPYC